MGTKTHPGQFDCYANAEPDEPIFVLRSTDPAAPDLVRVWAAVKAKQYYFANVFLARALQKTIDRKQELDAKFHEANTCADNMEQWCLGLEWAQECDAARTYKVIDVDNLGRDYQTEYLIEGTEGLSKDAAQQVADHLNGHRPYGGEFSSRYCTVVPNERKLYVFDGY